MWQAVGNTRMNQWGSGALLTEGDLGDSAAGRAPRPGRPALEQQPPQHHHRHRPEEHHLGGGLHLQVQGLRERGRVRTTASRSRSPPATRDSRPRRSTTRGSWSRLRTPSRRPACPGAAFWELAFRYVEDRPFELLDNNDRDEIGGAFSYYYNRHNLKVQADYRQLKDDAGELGSGDDDQGVPSADPVHLLVSKGGCAAPFETPPCAGVNPSLGQMADLTDVNRT